MVEGAKTSIRKGKAQVAIRAMPGVQKYALAKNAEDRGATRLSKLRVCPRGQGVARPTS